MERGDTFPAIVVVRPNASVKATPRVNRRSLLRWPQAVAGVPYRATLSLRHFSDPDRSQLHA
jgi:hypothetical protein